MNPWANNKPKEVNLRDALKILVEFGISGDTAQTYAINTMREYEIVTASALREDQISDLLVRIAQTPDADGQAPLCGALYDGLLATIAAGMDAPVDFTRKVLAWVDDALAI